MPPLKDPEPDGRCTSLVINNIHVYRVGEVIELLREAGFSVEINLTRLPDGLEQIAGVIETGIATP